MAYASSVWVHNCMKLGHHRGRANTAQRLPLLAITGAYKTTSTIALQILAGVPPLDLKLVELAKVEGKRSGQGPLRHWKPIEIPDTTANETIRLWNDRWVASDKGRWTAKWFPSVGSRLARGWCTPDHFTSQLMSGHGDFNFSLHRFHLRDEASCRCGFVWMASQWLWSTALVEGEGMIGVVTQRRPTRRSKPNDLLKCAAGGPQTGLAPGRPGTRYPLEG